LSEKSAIELFLEVFTPLPNHSNLLEYVLEKWFIQESHKQSCIKVNYSIITHCSNTFLHVVI
jgi:hypothetical protein